jgi:hypothetical protein
MDAPRGVGNSVVAAAPAIEATEALDRFESQVGGRGSGLHTGVATGGLNADEVARDERAPRW